MTGPSPLAHRAALLLALSTLLARHAALLGALSTLLARHAAVLGALPTSCAHRAAPLSALSTLLARRASLLLALCTLPALLPACPSPSALAPLADADGDGAVPPADCDDDDPAQHPAAFDRPDDGIDQDCNGVDAVTCYYDGDGDGFGSSTTQVELDGDCTDDPLDASVPGDCDDSRADFSPGAEDIPDDGFDQDCSGADTAACFLDLDADGAGSDAPVLDDDGDCTDLLQAPTSGDCDDDDPFVRPGASDAPGDGVDSDCNGVDAALCAYDGDGDGFGYAGSLAPDPDGACDGPAQADNALDCDDSRADLRPGAEEIPGDGLDQDCSGADAVLCAADDDGDGFGAGPLAVDPDGNCADPGQALAADDCDDTAPATYPFAPELPDNGIDEDCDGVDGTTCFYDGDGDGFGWPGTVFDPDGDCTDDPFQSPLSTDCDDSRADIYPGAPVQIGDGIDQDCNGTFE